jgi:hypothetical protein
MWVYIYTEKQEWQPWANTIAYYPLTSNTNDMKGWGTAYDLTPVWTFNYGTLASWKKYIIFDKTAEASISNIPFNRSAYTVSAYAFFNWPNNSYQKIILECYDQLSNYRPRFFLYQQQVLWACSFEWHWVTYTANQRYLFTTVMENNVTKEYINWNLIHSASVSGTSSSANLIIWGTNSNYNCNWWMSKLILEDKARTADEITAYYNLTKSNYWL